MRLTTDWPYVDLARIEAFLRITVPSEKAHTRLKLRNDCVSTLASHSYESDDWVSILASLGYIRKALNPLDPEFLRKNWRCALGVLQYHRCWRAACRLLREAIAMNATESR